MSETQNGEQNFQNNFSQPAGGQAGDPNAAQYQQGFQEQQGYGQQWAPSAYSAPAPGQGQAPYGYQQPPVNPSAFGYLFNLDFNKRGGKGLAKIAQILAIVAAGILLIYALFALIAVLSSGYSLTAMDVISALFAFALQVSIALLIPAATRLLGEAATKSDSEA